MTEQADTGKATNDRSIVALIEYSVQPLLLQQISKHYLNKNIFFVLNLRSDSNVELAHDDAGTILLRQYFGHNWYNILKIFNIKIDMLFKCFGEHISPIYLRSKHIQPVL